MRTPLPALLLLLSACAPGESRDFVVYRPAADPGERPARSRTLLVTAERGALLVTRSFGGGGEIRAGDVPAAGWEELRAVLARMRGFSKTADSPRYEAATFQIYARLGEIAVEVERDPEAPMERESADARRRLDLLAGALPVPKDPVAALRPFLSSPVAHVRGPAVLALLQIRKDPAAPAELRTAADRELRARERVEADREILESIRNR